MRILILNSGSSSLKYKLFDAAQDYKILASGVAERIGLKRGIVKQVVDGHDPICIEEPISSHKTALEYIRKTLTDPAHAVLNDFNEIDAVGHRVVHGGEKFSASVLITDDVIAAIKDCCDLAPLHNPPNLLGIEACQELLPGVPQVAVFDTAFHQTMPKKAFLYGLEYNQYTRYGIRRYGFHGTSHGYVAKKAAEILGKELNDLKLITCHLGNGCSLAAVSNGECIDTSMGLTPLEGVLMGTRCGDIDPYIPLYIMDKEGLTLDELNTLLNKKSGLLGLCGKRDMRDVLVQAEKKDELARMAIEVFAYRIAKYIGAYTTAMNGVHAIVFTAGVGENCGFIRQRILDYFTYLGIEIDQEKNDTNQTFISTSTSSVSILVIPTNEELVIAQDTRRLISSSAD
jgi:acetate kinase